MRAISFHFPSAFGIKNLTKLDPFDANEDEEKGGSGSDALVHIRIQQRNGRKTLTTVQVCKLRCLDTLCVIVWSKLTVEQSHLGVIESYKSFTRGLAIRELGSNMTKSGS